MANLGVNIDHVATIRRARGTQYPDPVEAAVLCQLAGAEQITVHLREDRRHIIDRDLRVLREVVQIPLNLEMGNAPEMVEIALAIKPDMVTLVPEKREELTTEGGLAVATMQKMLERTLGQFREAGIPVSFFIDPKEEDIIESAKLGVKMIELHTGRYSELKGGAQEMELHHLRQACEQAHSLGMVVHAGHGLNYTNAKPVARLPHICDLNIGHSIIARAVLVGLDRAVREMKELIGK